MARKRQKNIRIDEGILNEFEKIANKKGQHHNTEIEELMKQYISRDGQMLFDDLYAPRIAHSVKQAVEDQINRLAKMIYKTQVDATAALYSSPMLHNQVVRGVEDVIDNYMNPQLLNQNRVRVSDRFTFANTGKTAVRNMRNIALHDHKEAKKETSTEATKVNA